MSANLWLTFAILSEVVATSLLSSTNSFTRLLPSLGVGVGYVTAFYCLSVALKDVPVGVAYAVWSGAGIVLVTAVAWIAHGQRIDALQAFGMTMIVIGVALCRLRA
jgi:small multidrug resistance pump